ncbi:RRM domain-containing protein [Aphelenchoides besseyi]|nr:RRM domain-containing protein [Aphelenchoides besseyi]
MSEPNKPEEENENLENSSRVKVANIPGFVKLPQLRKLLDTILKDVQWKKLTYPPGSTVAFFSANSPEEALKAITIMHGFTYKDHKLIAFKVAEKEDARSRRQVGWQLETKRNFELQEESKPSKTVTELTTPLCHLSYEDQIEYKYKESMKTARSLVQKMRHAYTPNARYIKPENLLKPIIRCDVTEKYRNKIECTIGFDEHKEPCVGFVSGRMAERQFVIVPVNESSILTDKMKIVVNRFTELIKNCELPPFSEFTREGFWKKLIVRDFANMSMIIVTVHPLKDDEEKMKLMQKLVIETFVDVPNETEHRVDSIYWQLLENASDPVVFEHIAGREHIFETLLDVRFRVSAQSFFQTNSRGAALLYTAIGDLMGLPSSTDVEMSEKSNDENGAADEKPVAILDICCGAGTIGMCLLERVRRTKTKRRYASVGVELIKQAVEDARINASENGFSSDQCRFIEGTAEIVFRNLNHYLDADLKMNDPELIGVLDPPRSGVSDRVVISCRKLESMKKIIYVSCDPNAASKNLVDLCRAESNKYEGDPFRITTIQPVDLFPNTSHIEWVIELTR